MIVIDVREQVNLIELTNFISTVIGPKLEELSCGINALKLYMQKNGVFLFEISFLRFGAALIRLIFQKETCHSSEF